MHTGVELPAHPDKVARAYYLRTAIGKTFATNGGLGRRWTPMVEFIGDRELVSGATTNWDVIPEIQIPLSKRMHVLGSLGVKLPANNTDGPSETVMFYVLWDWMDGASAAGLVGGHPDVQDPRIVARRLLALAAVSAPQGRSLSKAQRRRRRRRSTSRQGQDLRHAFPNIRSVRRLPQRRDDVLRARTCRSASTGGRA